MSIPTRVRLRREPEEVVGLLAFPFPGIGQVGVVHHDDHDPAVVVRDAAHVGRRAVFVPALDGASPRSAPGLDRGHLRNPRHPEHRVPHRMVRRREVHDGELTARQHAPDFVVELRLRQAAVIVGHQQEAAFQQVLPQPLHFGIGEPRRAGVFHQRERTPEQPIVSQPDDHGVGDLLFAVGDALHGHLRQLGRRTLKLMSAPG